MKTLTKTILVTSLLGVWSTPWAAESMEPDQPQTFVLDAGLPMADDKSSPEELLEAFPSEAGTTFTLAGMTFSSIPCAVEGQTCTLPKAARAVYGADRFRLRSLPAGPFLCSSATFGNVATSAAKACYVESSVAVAPAPAPAAAPAPAPAPAPATTSVSPVEASRFLVQASFGPNMSSISSVAQSGPAAWIENQFMTPSLETHWTYVMERKGPPGCNPCTAQYVNAVMESFWRQAVLGPDQLRQRLTFALSEIFVVSTVNSPVEIQKDAHASYIDMLSRNSFGNFRTLLEQVATHPTMGKYLSHMGNMKEDPTTGRLPDENFARELMQLFTVGLWELNPDGSRKKNANGQDIPTYSQADVMGMAKVFTGWGWGNGDWNAGFIKPTPAYDPYARDWNHQMINYASYHSASQKSILKGVVIPAGTSGEQSLKIALDTLFNHPNVGPFIGSQLIKRFVTSNPSPAYVSRVTAAFNNNGQGVRGDMKTVIKAVLLDPEARDASKVSDPLWGKLREPMVRYANFMRAFDVKATSGYYKIWNLEDPVSSIGQNPLRAPSVFNWFTPTYAPTGDLMNNGMVAPEFAITHETTVTGYANFIIGAAQRQTNWWRDNQAAAWGPVTDYLGADYSAEMALAANPVGLVDRLNLLLAAGRMSGTTKQAIIDAISTIPATQNSGFNRVSSAVALTLVSPDFIVQK